MGAKMITRYFQDLYAADAVITYIRTVSVVASPEAIKEARAELSKEFGKHFVPSSPRVYKDKGSANSGHECIRNVLDDKTGKLVNKKFSDPKKQQVFDLIRLRFLASQSIDSTGLTWTAIIDSTDKKAKFSASETEILEPGWTAVYQLDEEVGA
jgi:DNA topoisomerase-1